MPKSIARTNCRKTWMSGRGTDKFDLYYEATGEGPPMLLVHGNGEDHTIFDKVIPVLSISHRVYAVDSRGHGKSPAADDYDYEEMAEDYAALIRALGMDRPIFYGFSDGGIIGLILALRYPGLLAKLIVSGANVTPKGLRTWCRAQMWFEYIWKRDPKIRLMLFKPQIPLEELEGIRVPVLLLAGGRDVVKETHTRAIASHIKGAKLLILPGESHESYVVHSEKLYDVIKDFL